MIGAHSVICHDHGRDKYHGILARCLIGTTDLQKTMVRAGWAIANRRFSSDYVATKTPPTPQKPEFGKAIF